MIVKIQDEEKVLQRHLLMKFRTLFQLTNFQGQYSDYNLYLDNILYVTYEFWEIPLIIREKMCIKFINKNQDPLTKEIENINLPDLAIRPEKFYGNRTTFLAKTQKALQQQFQQKQNYQSQTKAAIELKPNVQAGIKENNNILIRIPIIQALNISLVVILQILKETKKNEILLQFGDFTYQISENDKDLQITMAAFQDSGYRLDLLAEFFSYNNISVFWNNQESILAIQWPNNYITALKMNPNNHKITMA